ncbi:uncharacterized protein Z518_09149 [Rhinocladiella mackenziei CBS 650.93]|uniref:DUF3752 domain-containing protein n=1 Tax=Rhinocladiella mackenziei CBS 650.93 TaxID=1442369 RepID=A0A0D2GSU0_9EURO|nr:uncharacterized protein Z518_09149 [Rhinocladiella mackenziei CBS 650.93]KIX01423.1 hypothetical protein Z518_09149 [Rhinocladiella mackenziei CBS 650.93]
MSPVGPQLPPELRKRKRSDNEDENDSSDSVTSPSPGPLPGGNPEKEKSPPSAKRTRIIGPTLPPVPLDDRPPSSPPQPDQEVEESSNEDDFGPSLPSAADAAANSSASKCIGPQIPGPTLPAEPAKRDEWMTLAPAGGDWSPRVDPTKLKNRKFNTGRGAKGPSQPGGGPAGASWHETPEEKQARLKREVMGIKDKSTSGKSNTGSEDDIHDEVTARRLKEYSESHRGPSLYASHQARSSNSDSKVAQDDDPSARAFDREKDIAGGATITATQRRDMVKKAADFSSRFGAARYL